MAAQLSCSFASHSNSTCNFSARFPGKNDFFPLSSCTKDIKSHLRQLKVAQTSVSSERDLILARVGLFDRDGNDMTVCPKHRAALGTWWRPTLKCYHPLHGNKRRKPERGASLQMCKDIMTKWKVLVPVGAGICKLCRSEHGAAVFEVPTSLELQPSAEPIAVRESETSLSSLQEQPSEVMPTLQLPAGADDSNSEALSYASQEVGPEVIPTQQLPVGADDASSDAFSSASQESVPEVETSLEWQPTPQVQHRLHYLNNFFRNSSDGRVSPVRSQLCTDVFNLSPSSSRYYKRKAVQAVETVLEAIAPEQSTWLFHRVVEKYSRGRDRNVPDNQLLARLVKLYEEANSWYTRQQILSIFVCDHPKSELLTLIPGLTKWRIDEARKHAFLNEPVQQIEPPQIKRSRLHPAKVDHFLDFVSSPSFLQDVAYGTKKLRLSDGDTLEIPNVVRTVIASRLVQLYTSYCSETGFEPLGRSTLFNILKVCAASKKKSLTGLDSIQTDGVCAFATLAETAERLCSLGLQEEGAKDIKRRLKSARHYLKTDYKIHLSRESPCPDHCRQFALSSSEPEFHGSCAHQHTVGCDRCEDLKNAIADLQLAFDSPEVKFSKDLLEELQYDVDNAIPDIDGWKAHILRAAHQDTAKSAVVENLTNNQVLIIMDWAMKFLPIGYRETQRDWFGKKGKSWHVSVAVKKGDDGEIETRSYIHLFDKCTQNWFAVASILESTLVALKSSYSNLSEAFLRSDNAGCYHNAFLILSLPSIGERARIRILRYDFSDPQAGKDVCDRRIATLKSHMRRFINEGNDINTAKDMKVAIESYGGVKGCYATVAEIQGSFQSMTKHSMTGIQALNNFLFEPAGLRVWKAYNVGTGKFFSLAQLKKYGTPQGPTGIKELQPFSRPSQDVGTFRAVATQAQDVGPSALTEVQIRQSEEAESATRSVASYSCPEQGCVKIYQEFKSLQKHLDVGRHLIKLERESDYDSIIAKWAQTCKTVTGDYVQGEIGVAPSVTESPSVSADSPSLEEGWALKKAKKSTRFSEHVRSFLQDAFFQGEQTGVKANPADIASKMKSLRSPNGNKLFRNDEWLSTLQVARYFSRLSALNKRGVLKRNVSVPQEEEEDLDYVSEIEAMETRFQIRREVEL